MKSNRNQAWRSTLDLLRDGVPCLFSNHFTLSAALPCLLLFWTTHVLKAQDYLPVTKADLVNVLDFGARGDGISDDTAAIQKCITNTCSSTSIFQRNHIIYFPNGVYMITNQLQWKDGINAWSAFLSFRGQSTTGTVIRLAAGATTFNTSTAPKGMIYTASSDGAHSDGGGNTGFGNDIVNLTLDVGTNHAGAMGIDWNANNQACIENVNIVANDPTHTGFAGLYLGRQWPGPCLVKNLEVQGFNYGILCTNQDRYGVTFSGLTLNDQKIAGLQNDKQVVTMENLSSDQTYAHVPAVRQDGGSGYGLVTLIGATCVGGSSSYKAITLTSGHAYLRQVMADVDYAATLQTPGGTNVAGTISEWYSDGAPKSLYANPAKSSLGLEMQATPDFQEGDSNKWVCVTDFGAQATTNSSDITHTNSGCFQNAIDSTLPGGSHAGATVVYVPYGIYLLEKPLILRGTVRKFIGFGTHLMPKSGYNASYSGQALIQFTSATTNSVTFEGFVFEHNYWPATENLPDPTISIDTTNTITLRHLNDGNDGSYQATANARDVFVEDVYNNWWDLFNASGHVWARQLDPENQSQNNTSHYHIRNHGAKLWVLGLKSEGWGDVIDTDLGGQTEVLGGLTFVWTGPTDDTFHGFTSTNSSSSLVYAMNTDGDYPHPILESRNGSMQWLAHASLLSRGNGSVVPLFVGYSTAAAPALIWRGDAVNSNWDGSSINWYNGTVLQAFANNSDVTFDDTARVSPSLNAILQPNSVTVNATNNYTFAGSGSLTGPLALAKDGSGTLLINTTNSFTGGVYLNDGIVQLGNRSALGLATSAVNIDGGTLDVHGVQGITNLSFNIQGTGYTNGGAIQNFSSSGSQTVNGIASLTLLGDATIGASGARWDVYGSTPGNAGVQGNDFNLTKVGAKEVWFIDGGTNNGLADITICAGTLGFQQNTDFGDPASTITACPGALLSTYKIPTNMVLYKTIVFSNAFYANSISNVTLGGPVVLFGTNTQINGYNESATNQAIFNGIITGPGSWVKADTGIDVFNAANTYAGATIITSNSLMLGPGASLASSLIEVATGATLDARAALNGLNLGGGQTLAGSGTVLGNVNLTRGSTLALAAAFSGSATYTLTLAGNLVFQPGSTNCIGIKKTTSIANDQVVSLASVTMGGTLVINNLGNALASGDAISLFGAGSCTGSFSSINPVAPGPKLAWDTSMLSSGILRVTSVNTTPTNLTARQTGKQMTLSWPFDHTGWQLQAQSSSPAAGIGTNWINIDGSALTDQVTLPLGTNPAAFYRMIYTN